MSILISKKSAAVAMIASVPFVGAAIYFWVRATFFDRWPMDWMIHGYLAHGIFIIFGFPLTWAYARSMPFIGRFLTSVIGTDLGFLVVPVYILLLELQWIIWSQLLAIVIRRLTKKRPR